MSFGQGFAQGFNTTFGIVNNVMDMRRRNKEYLRQEEHQAIMDKGLDVAKQTREQDISSQIERPDVLNEEAFNQPDKLYGVKGNQFATEEQALQSQQQERDIAAMQAPGGNIAPEQLNQRTPNITESYDTRNMALPEWRDTYQVGDKQAASEAEARKIAETNVGSEHDYFVDKAIPYFKEAYLRMGQPEKAMAFEKWADDSKQKSRMKEWAAANQAYQLGKYDDTAKYFTKQFNESDGEKATKMIPVFDDNNNFAGYDATIKGEDGNERVVRYNPDMVEMGFMATSPEAMFENEYKKRQAEVDAKAKAGEQQRKFAYDWKIAEFKASNAKELAIFKAEIKRAEETGKIEKARKELKQAGMSDAKTQEMIEEYLPRIMGWSYSSDTFNEQEQRAKLLQSLAKDVPGFTRKPESEQRQMVESLMGIIKEPPQQTNPAQGGLPASSQQPRSQIPIQQNYVP